MTSASTALRVFGPKAAVTAMARMICGKAKTRSVSRINASSASRPRYPATSPSRPPTSRASETMASASGIDNRAPYTTRLKMSRPRESVPNQWAAEGAA